MTEVFTQGYPDWGRVLNASPSPIVNEFQVNHNDGDQLGPFPIAGWQSVFYRLGANTADVRFKFRMAVTDQAATVFQEETRWSRGTFYRRGWLPLVGNFLFILLNQAAVAVDDPTDTLVVPVPYVLDTDRKLADTMLLHQADTAIGAGATTTFTAIEPYVGPASFYFTTSATAWNVKLNVLGWDGVTRQLYQNSGVRAGLPSEPCNLYIPDGRVSCVLNNQDAASKGFSFQLVPRLPSAGIG